MLTIEEREARTRTLGASEAAAVAGIDPSRTALDVYCAKRRSRDLSLPPLIDQNEEPDEDKPLAVMGRLDTSPMVLGHLFEQAIADAYAYRTGHTVRPSPGRLVHSSDAWASATPDRLVDDGGLELKLVGRHRRHHWPNDGVPTYVCVQVQWQMHVADWPFVDVAALVDGTDLRIVRVERDDMLIESLATIGRAFWEGHVLADVMPPAVRGDDAMRLLAAKWRRDNGETLTQSDPQQVADVARLARELLIARAKRHAAETEENRLKAVMCALIGPHRSIAGPWGHADWPSQQGNPRWKDIAEHLAGGAVPHELIEAHRVESFRRFGVYPHRAFKAEIASLVAEAGEEREEP